MEHSVKSDRILDRLDLRADPFAVCELRGESVLGLGRAPKASLHYVLAGKGTVRFRDQIAKNLRPGCLVLVPAGQWHALSSTGTQVADLPSCNPVGMNLEFHQTRGDGPGGLSVLCAAVQVGLRGSYGLIDLLREPLVLDTTEHPCAASAIERMLLELQSPALGSAAMVRALLLQCLIDLFRLHLLRDDPSLRWISALTEPRLWAAIQRMLASDSGTLSVEDLANVAGMSRSQFSLRFTEAMGEAPMEFLRGLRLARAGQMLIESTDPVKRIADKSGFQSRSAFTRAFIAYHGLSPQEFRQTMRRDG